MNNTHLQQIFANYIEKFEYMNGTTHAEYYKWQIVKRFRTEMDAALAAPKEDFSDKLKEVKKLTYNLIDSYTQPFQGLVTFAQDDPEKVRQMFLDLYCDDDGDLVKRQKRIQSFLKESHDLRDKYSSGSYLYKDDMHSVTSYLFLYDPDHNYIFKASHALKFADCVEFYDDWGSGESVKLDVYYRMCNQLVEEIKASRELMATDASRFDNGWGVDPGSLYPDPEKHILAFDLIYCCSTYNLFDGITFVRPKSKERQLMQERKEKAIQLSEKLEDARTALQELEQAKDYVNSVFAEGVIINQKMLGEGVIKKNEGDSLLVDFSEHGEKKLGTFVSLSNGLITTHDADMAKLKQCAEVIKKESLLKTGLAYAEKEFVAYAEYLE